MKTSKNILIAFVLNLAFSAFELFGGFFTGSVAIVSDAVHDLGDAISIGISFVLERVSKKQPDEKYTYGYARYSVIGSVITTFILLFGSCAVIFNAVNRIINPEEINYNGVIIFAVVGVCVNFVAAYFTRGGDSLNSKAVNLHMLEDVLGWAVVLVGAFVMKFTGFALIDPIMSICVSLFILISAVKNLKTVIDLFLEKTPSGTDVNAIREHICSIDGVKDVHHIHIRSFDGVNNCATMHVVADSADFAAIKNKVREELLEHGICHATIETETENEKCENPVCSVKVIGASQHCHHH